MEGHVRVADFGLSKEIELQTDTFCGSPEYMSPEMLTHSGHSWMTDIYTLGAMVYELITGLPPHYSEDKDEMYTNIIYTQLSFPPGPSEDVKDFLLELLEKDPSKRLGAKLGLRELKEHKWCKDIDWNLVYKKGLKPPYTPNLRTCNFDTEFLHIDYSGIIDLDSNQVAVGNSFIYQDSYEDSYENLDPNSPHNYHSNSDFESIILGPSLISSEVKSKLVPGETLPSPPPSPISRDIFESFLEVPIEGEKNEPKISLSTGSEFWNYLGGTRKTQSENNCCHLFETIDSFTKELYDLRDSMLLVPQEHKQDHNYSKIYVPIMPVNCTFSSIASYNNGFPKKKFNHIPIIPMNDKAEVTQKDKEFCTPKTATSSSSKTLIDN